MRQEPNEAVVYMRRGVVRGNYRVSFHRLDRPVWPFLERVDMSARAGLAVGDDRIAYRPQTLAAPSGALNLGRINLTLCDEPVQTQDGLQLYAQASTAFRLRRNRRALAVAMERRVFATFAVEFANRVRAVLAHVVGRERQVDAVAAQARIERRFREELSAAACKSLAVEIDAVAVSFTSLARLDEARGGGAADMTNELRRALRVFDEKRLNVTAQDVKALALALNDKEKLRILAEARAPVVIVPSEASGLVTPELLAEARDRRRDDAPPLLKAIDASAPLIGRRIVEDDAA